MKLSIGSQAYTNVVLTAIAALLLALAFDAYRIPVLGAAQAQPQSVFSRDKDDSGVNGNVSQTQDIAVASATREVAIANREIASAIREVGKSLDGLAAAVRTIKPGTAAPAGAAPASGPAASASSASDGIQVSTGSPR